jgi:hypothetical protein
MMAHQSPISGVQAIQFENGVDILNDFESAAANPQRKTSLFSFLSCGGCSPNNAVISNNMN